MSTYRDRGPKGKGPIVWRYRRVIRLPDGIKVRISGTPEINTKPEGEKAERAHIARALDPKAPKAKLPTLTEWFNGKFWTEWVIGQENRVGTQGEKRSAFKHHIGPALGKTPLDQIDKAAIQRFKAELIAKKGRHGQPLGPKTRNNILAVLSKALRYAEESGVLSVAPRVKMGKIEKPEIECLEFEGYARMVAAARADSPAMMIGVLLAGEAGLRIGEIIALTWEDLDLVAGTITVARQIRQGVEGPTKGGRPRKVRMTPELHRGLLSLAQIRRGRVLCTTAGEPLSEASAKPHGIYRVCRRAGLPERGWHGLRHSYATHAAQLGVNPWRLQAWLGHSSIVQTMAYVHHAEQHRRPIPTEMIAAAAGVIDADDRILVMLGVRASADYSRANEVPTNEGPVSIYSEANKKSVHATGFELALSRVRPQR